MFTKKPIVTLMFLLSFFLLSFQQKGHVVGTTTLTIQAPFDMPDISIPNFDNCQRFTITDFGAIAWDKVKTTKAIADAIGEANRVGGGMVVIPAGEWLTGKVNREAS
ncbi:MAG: hypothetical protein Q8914_14545 [Bacteroidota bacterium]|nr:hypothetical protein [Bacteroidota bacterium]